MLSYDTVYTHILTTNSVLKINLSSIFHRHWLRLAKALQLSLLAVPHEISTDTFIEKLSVYCSNLFINN